MKDTARCGRGQGWVGWLWRSLHGRTQCTDIQGSAIRPLGDLPDRCRMCEKFLGRIHSRPNHPARGEKAQT